MSNIFDKQVDPEYKDYMTRYAIETNWKRHTADVRDGLKTVQRRILDSLCNRLPGKTKYIKTARVVGDVIGNTHPHGDSSVKSAIKLMANWFDMKMPLIESESNMGSMQGETDAAARYTEIKLSEFAKECIAEIYQTPQVVDWKPTYDNSGKEPEFFPMAVPLLLVNGTFGLGTGLKTLVPSHNLGEVIDATINLIKNPNAQVVLVPDHCMGVDIIETNFKAISNKGNGKYIARARIEIEEHNGCYWLIIKSIPDMVYFDKGELNGGVKYSILDMVEEGKLPQITAIDEDSKGNDMRIVIKLKRGSDPEFVKQILYKETQLQTSYMVNFEALYDLKTIRFSYKSYLQTFIEQRRTTKYRYYCIKLQETNTKIHELDAYIKIIESGKINELTNMIYSRNTIDKEEVAEYLIKKIGLTDVQAHFILNLNLLKISKGYLNKYKEELANTIEEANKYKERILNESIIDKDIIEELLYFKNEYGEPRKSRIIPVDDVNNIPAGTFKIVITENNYIKKLNQNDYVGSYRGDNPKHILLVDNREEILLFTAQGRVFNCPVHKIPLCEKSSPGVDARILIKKLASDIQSVMYVPVLQDVSKRVNKHYIVAITYNGSIKKMDIEDFLTIPPSGILYTKLNEGDLVRSVSIVPDALDIIIYSNKKALRVDMESIPKYRRSSIGVNAMALKENTFIDGISIVYPDATDIVVVTEKGKINRFPVTGLSKSKRATTGSNVIKLSKDDRIKSIFGVNNTSDILNITTKSGVINLDIDSIKIGSSISTGDKVVDSVLNCFITKK